MNAHPPPREVAASRGSRPSGPPESDSDPSSQARHRGIEPGSLLNGTFRVRHRIAEGGMAELFLATHERLPGLFVVKTPLPQLAHDAQIAGRLRQEAEALASLDHPNIVRVFDFNETDSGTPYLVMEYLDGRDLNSILRARRLAPWEVASIVKQIAAALSAAHTRSIVHRDLKPENILVVPGEGEGEDVIKVIDFGVSKVERSPRVVSDVGLIGTPHYMAPEQAKGHRGHVDARTDQFALAVMTYEMLTRETPFGADDPLRILYRIVHEETPPMILKEGLQEGWTPAAVEATLRRAMAKDPAARYASVDEFARALADAVAADFGGPPAPLCLFQRAELEPRPVGEVRLTADPGPTPPPHRTTGATEATGATGSTRARHHRRGHRHAPAARRRRAPALFLAAAVAAAGLFYFRADVGRALPATARAQLGAVMTQIGLTVRLLPSFATELQPRPAQASPP